MFHSINISVTPDGVISGLSVFGDTHPVFYINSLIKVIYVPKEISPQ